MLAFGFRFKVYAVDEEDSDHAMDLGLRKLPEEASLPKELDHVSLHHLPLRRPASGDDVIRKL